MKMDVNEMAGGRKPLHLGFIPDADCAPIVVARESGLFEKYELSVQLHRQTAGGSLRGQLIEGDLDAAHVPASFPFATTLGIGSEPCACVSGIVLSLQGNAIVLAQRLWNASVRDASSLRDFIYTNWGKRTCTLGVAFANSPAHFLLRRWLAAGEAIPQKGLRVVLLPPWQLFPMLKLGYLDGYCAGEPWTSLAVEAHAGVCIARSAQLAARHPEKVLMVTREFAETRASEHERLIAALIEACAFCEQPENGQLLTEMLAQPQYVNAPAESLAGFASRSIFHAKNANEPTDEKAGWLIGHLSDTIAQSVSGIPPNEQLAMLKDVFRPDIFRRAQMLVFKQAQTLQSEIESYQTGG